MLGAAAATSVTLHTFLMSSQQPEVVDSFIFVRHEFVHTLGAASLQLLGAPTSQEATVQACQRSATDGLPDKC